MSFDLLVAIASVPIMFLLLVAPHEGGHFTAAKLTGMRVHEFSVGMGPRLFGWTRSATLYALRVLPVGGYVRIGGMEPGDYDDPAGFHAKPARSRLFVLFAGPLANFLVAGLIVTGIGLTSLNGDPGKIRSVNVPSPAHSAGIQPGDTVVAVNGQRITGVRDVRNAEDRAPGQPVTLTIRHAGAVRTVTVQPVQDPSSRTWMVGIAPEPVIGVGDALKAGVVFPVVAVAAIGDGMVQLVRGQVPGGAFGPQGVTGPIGIAAVTADAARHGIDDWLDLVAVLSMALGMANLLPIPALDGGRILVVLLEVIRRRPFNREREMRVQRAGLAAVLALIAVIAYFDVSRLVTHQFPVFR